MASDARKYEASALNAGMANVASPRKQKGVKQWEASSVPFRYGQRNIHSGQRDGTADPFTVKKHAKGEEVRRARKVVRAQSKE